MGDTLRSPTISTRLQRIAQQAVERPDLVFQTLAHLIDVEFLEEAYRRTRKDGAPGVDRVTAEQYAVKLGENLQDLHARLRTGAYRAPPVRRVWIAKEDGKQRPLGIPAFEDKIVQRAVHMVMNAVYEQDFFKVSYGYREGRSPHQALGVLRTRIQEMGTGWVIDADISGFFDTIDHRMLVSMIQQRINDGALIRLLGKWLHAGVLEAGQITFPERGTPQGGVISPLLANIYLHHVLDGWFHRDVVPRMKGRCFLVRFADDFVMGFEREDDARRVMEVLPKRFSRFGLTIHPTKTRLVDFRPPGGPGGGSDTFDFLGFTHYWGKSRCGSWVVKRRTSRKRFHRAQRAIWEWCRDERHQCLEAQRTTLGKKLNGHYQYYGIRGNFTMLARMRHYVIRAWHYWLNRRSRQRNLSWVTFSRLLESLQLPSPRIIHAV